MTQDQQRFARALAQTLTVYRFPKTVGADLNVNVDVNPANRVVVAENVRGVVFPVRVSADMKAAVPTAADQQEAFFLAGLDVQQHDRVLEPSTGRVWVVTGVPQLYQARRVDHHIEVMLERAPALDEEPQ